MILLCLGPVRSPRLQFWTKHGGVFESFRWWMVSGAKTDAEKELGDLRKLAADLAEHCSSQRRWRDEQLQKQAANELASERLRKEIQQLHSETERLQEEAKLTMHKRNRLEVEVQVAKPALDDAKRRCKDLEGRLISRVRELGDESERVRRLQHEADMAKARLAAMEGQSSFRGRKLFSPSDVFMHFWVEPTYHCASREGAGISRGQAQPSAAEHSRVQPSTVGHSGLTNRAQTSSWAGRAQPSTAEHSRAQPTSRAHPTSRAGGAQPSSRATRRDLKQKVSKQERRLKRKEKFRTEKKELETYEV